MKNVNFKFKFHTKQALVSASVYELSHESSVHLNNSKNSEKYFTIILGRASRVCALGCKFVIAIDKTQPVTSLSGIVQNCSDMYSISSCIKSHCNSRSVNSPENLQPNLPDLWHTSPSIGKISHLTSILCFSWKQLCLINMFHFFSPSLLHFYSIRGGNTKAWRSVKMKIFINS